MESSSSNKMPLHCFLLLSEIKYVGNWVITELTRSKPSLLFCNLLISLIDDQWLSTHRNCWFYCPHFLWYSKNSFLSKVLPYPYVTGTSCWFSCGYHVTTIYCVCFISADWEEDVKLAVSFFHVQVSRKAQMKPNRLLRSLGHRNSSRRISQGITGPALTQGLQNSLPQVPALELWNDNLSLNYLQTDFKPFFFPLPKNIQSNFIKP